VIDDPEVEYVVAVVPSDPTHLALARPAELEAVRRRKESEPVPDEVQESVLHAVAAEPESKICEVKLPSRGNPVAAVVLPIICNSKLLSVLAT
jgi:hypothetical protein